MVGYHSVVDYLLGVCLWVTSGSSRGGLGVNGRDIQV